MIPHIFCNAILQIFSFITNMFTSHSYAWLGDSWKYPQIRSVRYPKAGSAIPAVIVYAVDLSALKHLQRIAIRPPDDILGHPQPANGSLSGGGYYTGRMQWLAGGNDAELAVTFMNRAQTLAATVLCRPPAFACRTVHMERILSDGLVLANDRILFGAAPTPQSDADDDDGADDNSSRPSTSNVLHLNEFDTAAGFLFKRLPVRDGPNGFFRHIVFVSAADQRTLPLTVGRFEVTELVAWDQRNQTLYFMASPVQKAGERHLYRLRVRFNRTGSGAPAQRQHRHRMFVCASRPACMTCNNAASTYRLVAVRRGASGDPNDTTAAPSTPATSTPETVPNNCLYNRVRLSAGFGHYVLECLGPESPAAYLVRAATMHKQLVLDGGDELRQTLKGLALPQSYTLDVEIRDGFHAQVRLLLPPGLREDEDVAFPLVLHV